MTPPTPAANGTPREDRVGPLAAILADARKRLRDGDEPSTVANDLGSDLWDWQRGGPAEGMPPDPVMIGQLIADYPDLPPVVIDGWLRRGETGNIIAAPKIGKSWLTYLIALTVASGGILFGRFRCERGRVLLIDNELFPGTIAHRIATVAKAMGIAPEDYRDQIDVLHLRGRLLDIYGIAAILERVSKSEYVLIILDALYRAEPAGQTENENNARTRLYNHIDSVTAQLDCAWVNIHHASKGDQSGKTVTDVGAGAGSQSRAADTHIVLRPHEEEGAVVLEAAVRSFAPLEPLALRWEFPLWLPCDTLDPARLKGRLTAREQKQNDADRSGRAVVLVALQQDGPATTREIRRRTGMSKARAERYLDALEADGAIVGRDIIVRGNPCREYATSDVVREQRTT